MKTQNFLADPSHFNQLTPSDPSQQRMTYLQRHPMTAAALLWLLDFALVIAISQAAKALLPDSQPDYIAVWVIALLAVGALTAAGWWRIVGFNRPHQWHSLPILILPVLIAFVLPLVLGVKWDESGSFGYLLLGYLLVGFHEEAIFRGVILNILQPLGARRAVVVGAIFFGLAHLANLLVRSNPWLVLAQVVGAFCDGIGFGALRLRTNTLWFLIPIHAAQDLLLHYTNFPAIALNVAQVTIMMFLGFYLLRQTNAHAID
jgi:uncharacterized protein